MLSYLWIIGALVAVVWFAAYLVARRKIAKMMRLPFEVAEQLIAQPGASEKPYDIFISYRSQQAELARHLAERLMAGGLRVWFAEYCVTLYERHAFQAAIDRGLAHTASGICITSNAYFASPHCAHEFAQLLSDRSCGPEQVLAITTTRDALPAPYTHQLPAPVQITGGDVTPVQAWLGRKGWAAIDLAPPTSPPPARRVVFAYQGQPFSMDWGGWRQSRRSRLTVKDGDLYLPHFSLEDRERNNAIACNVIVSDQVVSLRAINRNADDRENYEDLLDFARQFYAGFAPFEVIGVHLIFVGQKSHPSFTGRRITTYNDPRPQAVTLRRGARIQIRPQVNTRLPGLWHRQYPIQLPHPRTGRAIEFLFSFQATGTFAEFCRLTPRMDALVQSFRWEPRRAGAREERPSESAHRSTHRQ